MMDEIFRQFEDDLPKVSYSRIYYCILSRASSGYDWFGGVRKDSPTTSINNEELFAEKGCIVSTNLLPSLHDAIQEINIHRKKENENIKRNDSSDISGSKGCGSTLTSISTSLEAPLFEDVPISHDKTDCTDVAGGVKERVTDFSYFFDEPVKAIQKEVQSPFLVSPRLCGNHHGKMDSILKNDDLNVTDIIAFTKVNVMDCIDGFMSMKDDCATTDETASSGGAVHRDAEDAYKLWVPVQHPYEPLTFLKEGEIHLKIVPKSYFISRESQSVTTVEEIDNIISSPRLGMGRSSEESYVSINGTAFNASFEDVIQQPAVHHPIQKEASDDFSSLLDESFQPSKTDPNVAVYGKEAFDWSWNKNGAATKGSGSEKSAVEEMIRSEVKRWAYTSADEIKDIRTLLYTLVEVLWEGAPWTPIDISACVDYRDAIKKHYRNALLLCHPDKHMRADWRRALRAQLVTQALQEAWSVSASD